MMKIAFVDLDGVLIPLKEESFKSLVFNPIAVAMLNCFTGETGAHIVASSRKTMDMGVEQVQELFTANCVHANVIGRISHPLVGSRGTIVRAEPKGQAIQRWLEMAVHVLKPDQYVIFDDEEIPEHPNNTVLVDPLTGFVSLKYFDQAKSILMGETVCR
jgi:hypothetical protein